jgi:hypothetical protein
MGKQRRIERQSMRRELKDPKPREGLSLGIFGMPNLYSRAPMTNESAASSSPDLRRTDTRTTREIVETSEKELNEFKMSTRWHSSSS